MFLSICIWEMGNEKQINEVTCLFCNDIIWLTDNDDQSFEPILYILFLESLVLISYSPNSKTRMA